MNLLDLAVKIAVDDQASSKIGGIASGITSKLSTVAKVAAGAVASAAGGVTAITTAALGAYSSYEQLVGGVDKLYGEASGKLQQYAANAYKTSGMSANQYMEQATSFSAALISSLSGDTQKAADLTDLAMRSMSDNVNVFGSDMQSVQWAFQGFAKQNYTMLDNLKLGYGGTKEEMERLIADAAQMTDAQAALGVTVDGTSMSFDNIVKAIAVVQQNMGIMGTTSREAAGTIEGSVNMMKAAWTNWITGLGNTDADMTELTNELVDSVITAGSNIVPRVAVILSSLVETAASYAPQIGDAIINGLSDVGSKLISVLPEPVQSAIETVVTTAQSAFSSLAGAISSAIEPASGVMDTFSGVAQTAFQLVSDKVNSVIETFQQIATIVQPILDGIVQGVQDFAAAFVGSFSLSGGLESIQGFTDALSSLSSPLGMVQSIVQQFGPQLQQLTDTIGSSLSPILSTLGQILGGTIAAAIPAVTAAFSAFQSILGAVIPMITNIASVALPAVSSVLQTLAPVIQQVVTVVSQVVQAVAPLIAQLVSQLAPVITNIVTAVMNFVTAVAPVVTAVISAIMSAINAILPILTTVLSVVTSVISTIITFIGNLVAVVMNIVSVVISVVGSVISAVSNVFQVISSVFSLIMSVIGGAISFVVSTVTSGFNGVLNIVSSVVNSVAGFISSLFSKISSTFSSIVSTIGGAMSSAFSAVSSTFGNIVSAVSDAIGNVISTVQQLPGKITGFFADAGSWLLDAGRSIIDGLVSGIKGAVDGAVSAVSGVVDTIRSFFPFSPAKRGPFSGHGYTTYSGKALMSDFASSIVENGSSAVDAVESVLSNVQDAIDSEPVFDLGAEEETVKRAVTVTSDGGGRSVADLYAAIQALHGDLGDIINANTPVMTRREFRRAVLSV